MTQRSPVTTHVLDVALGRPACGVPVRLERVGAGSAEEVGAGVTDVDGRVNDLLAPGAPSAGTYRITFELDAYFAATQRESFYPFAQIVFRVAREDEHYHVPLLLSPFGYSTYRGS